MLKFESICTHMFMLSLLRFISTSSQRASYCGNGKLLHDICCSAQLWCLCCGGTALPGSAGAFVLIQTSPSFISFHCCYCFLVSRCLTTDSCFTCSFNRCSRTFSNSQCSLRPPLSLLSITFKHTPKMSPPAWAWSPHNLCCPPSRASSHSNKKQPLIRWRSILFICMCQIANTNCIICVFSRSLFASSLETAGPLWLWWRTRNWRRNKEGWNLVTALLVSPWFITCTTARLWCQEVGSFDWFLEIT